MTIHQLNISSEDPLRSARDEEVRRVARWDHALAEAYVPPLASYFDQTDGRTCRQKRKLSTSRIQHPTVRFPEVHLGRPFRLAGRLVLGGTVAVLAFSVAFAGWVQFGQDPLVERAQAAIDCSAATMVIQVGEIPHIMPNDLGESCSRIREHLSVPYADAETTWRKATYISSLEGRFQLGETVYGLDAWGVARFIAGQLGIVWAMNKLGLRATEGGSAPLISAFETSLGYSGSMRNQLPRKIRLVAAAMQYTRIHLDTNKKRATFLAIHMPIVRGLGMAPVAGAYPELLLFSGDEGALVRDCITAGAAGFPILAGGSDRARANNWKRVKVRAESCIKLNGATDRDIAEALGALETYQVPVFEKPRAMPAAVTNALFGFLKTVDLAAPKASLSLTLNKGMQNALTNNVNRAQAALEQKLDNGFCLKKNACENRLNTLIAIAEILPDGLPVRAIYNTRQGLLFGPTRATENGYTAIPDRLGTASLAKLLLLPAVAKANITTLCNKSVEGFKNVSGPAGVTSCNRKNGRGYVSIRKALSKSMNLPWIEAARIYHTEVTRIQNALGYPVGNRPDTPTEMALGFGRYGSPAAIMTLAAALVNKGRTGGLTLVEGSDGKAFDLLALGYTQANIALSADWFHAPVEPGGTMKQASRSLNADGCKFSHAKSGTHYSDGRTQAKYSLAIVSCKTRRYVVYAGISGSTAMGSVRGIKQHDLVSIYRKAFTGK